MLTTKDMQNHSDIEVSTVSAGASSDMSQMAMMAVGAALSALGNKSEHESGTTKSAISSNIKVQITDSEKQKSLTGKTAEETYSNEDLFEIRNQIENKSKGLISKDAIDFVED